MPDAPALTVRLRHTVDTFSIEADFQIQRWPAVLFGPSGAGKSTVLRMIAGLSRADEQHIVFGDHVLRSDQRNERVKLMQLVTQQAALFPHLDVAKNVSFGLAGSGRTEARVQEMLALLGAEQLRDRMPAKLSGGERQRIVIARALAPAPRLLLLDEPFAGLDSSAKEEILGRLMPYCREHGIACLHVTHEISDAFALQAHVVVMRKGRIVAEGSAEEALADERKKMLALLKAP